MTVTVGLVDDQKLVRAGFAMVLASQDDIEVLWEADNGAAAIEHARNKPVDVILMDVQMPVVNGIEATAEILSSTSETTGEAPPRIIMLTTFASENYVLGAIQAGASGFLLKDTEPADLLQAIRTVSESTAIISPNATASLLRALRTDTSSSLPTAAINKSISPDANLAVLAAELTARETEILKLIATGYTNQEIADKLFISLTTVKTHVGKILQKTYSRDRVHAVLFALAAGVVSHQEVLAAA